MLRRKTVYKSHQRFVISTASGLTFIGAIVLENDCTLYYPIVYLHVISNIKNYTYRDGGYISWRESGVL